MKRTDARPNSERKTKAGDAYSREMDAQLLERPPAIRWERRGLIFTAVEVEDPHTEKPMKPRPIYNPPLPRPAKPAERETPLLAAARTEI